MRLQFALLAALSLTLAARAENWPQWRGPAFNGSSPEKDLPETWTKETVKWSAPLPGPSGATPVVWGDSVFVTSPDKQKNLLLLCLDRKDGKVRWQKQVATGDITKGRGNMASPSPITDGKLVYTFFGTGDFAALDFDGNIKWQRNLGADYGRFAIMWLYGSSPLLFDGKLYVQVLQRAPAPPDYPGLAGGDPARESYLLALDPATGKTLWKHVRPTTAKMESLESYSTPIPTTGADGKAQILVYAGRCFKDQIKQHHPLRLLLQAALYRRLLIARFPAQRPRPARHLVPVCQGAVNRSGIEEVRGALTGEITRSLRQRSLRLQRD